MREEYDEIDEIKKYKDRFKDCSAEEILSYMGNYEIFFIRLWDQMALKDIRK